jgi:hypothetical protein
MQVSVEGTTSLAFLQHVRDVNGDNPDVCEDETASGRRIDAHHNVLVEHLSGLRELWVSSDELTHRP